MPTATTQCPAKSRADETEVRKAAALGTKKFRDECKDNLRGQFDDFVESSTPEERALLSDVFSNRDNRTHRGDSNTLGIAYGFEVACNPWPHHYVRVPEEIYESFRNLMATLSRKMEALYKSKRAGNGNVAGHIDLLIESRLIDSIAAYNEPLRKTLADYEADIAEARGEALV